MAGRAESGVRRARVARLIIGLGVAALSCWLLGSDLDWQEVWAALAGADYHWVAAGALAIVGTFFTRVRRWQALLWTSRVPFRPAVTALLVGQVANHVLPMRSGDVARALWIGPEGGTGASKALGSVAVEKVWDLLALLACGLILLVWAPLPDWFARSIWGTALALLIVCSLLWALLRWQEQLFDSAGRLLARLPAGWGRAILRRLRWVAEALGILREPRVWLRALVWTTLTWGLGALANLAVLAAFGLASSVVALLLLALLMAGAAVPVPGQLGIFEGICVVSLALFGIPRDEALAVGLVLHLTVLGPPLIAALVLVLWHGVSSRKTDEPA